MFEIVILYLTLILIIIIYIGVCIMTAIDNLNQAIADLQETVSALVVPVNNDVAIQDAANSINASIAALKAKTV